MPRNAEKRLSAAQSCKWQWQVQWRPAVCSGETAKVCSVCGNGFAGIGGAAGKHEEFLVVRGARAAPHRSLYST